MVRFLHWQRKALPLAASWLVEEPTGGPVGVPCLFVSPACTAIVLLVKAEEGHRPCFVDTHLRCMKTVRFCLRQLSTDAVGDLGLSAREQPDMQGTWSCGTVFSRVAHLVPCGRWLCLDDDFDEARPSQQALCPLVVS